jgi:diaminobutyrate-2-oxoglutarate transaminase
VLIRPDLDQWKPGEHTGTFRGNNLAFVAATELFSYWDTSELSESIEEKEHIIRQRLEEIAARWPELGCEVRGRGMIYGLKIASLGMAQQLSREAFERGLVIELSGARDDVLKLLPPLVIEEELLRKGLDIIDESLEAIMERRGNGEFDDYTQS